MVCLAFNFGCSMDCSTCRDNEDPADITVGEVVRMQEQGRADKTEIENLKRLIIKAIGMYGQPDDEWTAEAAKILEAGK